MLCAAAAVSWGSHHLELSTREASLSLALCVTTEVKKLGEAKHNCFVCGYYH